MGSHRVSGKAATSPTSRTVRQIPPLPQRGKSVIRLPRQVAHPPTDFLKGPPGSKITLVADGLDHPRWLTVAENGELFVVESRLEIKTNTQPNRVTVIGKDGSRTIFADNLYLPFGIAFYQIGRAHV